MQNGYKRVVVTGMGAITPLGQNVETFWNNLLAGESVAGPITHFDASEYAVRIAAEVKDFDPSNWMDRKDARKMDRFVQFAVAAAQQAIENSGLKIDESNADDIGVLFGSGIGGLGTIEEGCRTLIAKGPMRVSPLISTMLIVDIASGQISIRNGLRGPNFAIVSACASGNNTLGEAFEIIRRGDALAMVTGASEAAITPLGIGAFHRTGALSTRNDDGAHASRPFEANRDGFVFGEGAGSLVLEELEFATARGANILAEMIGYGASADAYHVTAPEETGYGATLAMTRALRKAGLEPTDIDYINAHGTSTPLNDKIETLAIKRVFGEHAYKMPISSTKSMTGHLIGAAGVCEAIASVMTIRNGIVHPTINYETPDPDCDLDYVPNRARCVPVRTVLSNSFGFGGHNATLVFRAYNE